MNDQGGRKEETSVFHSERKVLKGHICDSDYTVFYKDQNQNRVKGKNSSHFQSLERGKYMEEGDFGGRKTFPYDTVPEICVCL